MQQPAETLAVTAHPTAAWTAQQLREVFPWDKAPRFLIHDRDLACAAVGSTARAMDINDVLTAPRSPWRNRVVERFIGSVRRECLDHAIIWNTAGLQRLLQQYVTYYQEWRTHLSLDKDAPIARRAQLPSNGAIGGVPHVGGLHHHYEYRAA